MKRLACLLLVVVLVAAMTVPAFSAIYRPDGKDAVLSMIQMAKNRMGTNLLNQYPYYIVFSNVRKTDGSEIDFLDANHYVWFFDTPSVTAGSKCHIVYFLRPTSVNSFYQNYTYSGSDFNANNHGILRLFYDRSDGVSSSFSYWYVVKDASTAYLADLDVTNAIYDWEINVFSPPVDKTALTSLVNSLQLIENIGYSPISWMEFQNALQLAISLLDSSDATQEQIDSAYNTLQLAFDGLVLDEPPPDESSEPDKPLPIVIGGYDVPDHVMSAVSSGNIMDFVSDFTAPFLDHAMSAFSFAIPLLGLLLATKLIPKIFRFFMR